jgi:hypothetical protein
MRHVLVVTLSTGMLATACGHHHAVPKSGWRDVRGVIAYFGSAVSPRDGTLEAIVRTIRFTR